MAIGNSHDEETFQRLVVELRSPAFFERLQAAEALGRLGDVCAVEPLIAALDDPEWPVCVAAMTALGLLGDESAVHPIELAFQRSDSHRLGLSQAFAFAQAASESLRQLGEPGFHVLLRLLRIYVEHEPNGATLARTLGEMADPRALETLLSALRSSVYEVAQAAESVSNLGDIAIDPLVRMLGDENSGASYHASQSLQWIGPSSIPKLLEAVESTDETRERANIIGTLGKFDDDTVVPSLVEALSDSDADVRETAALALGDRRDARAIEQLLLIEQRNSGSNVAALTLADIGKPAVVPLMSALADMERPTYVRYNAACALGFIGDAQATKSLVEVLQNTLEDDRVGAAAATALGQLKALAAIPPLLDMLSDSAPVKRKAAIQALGQIADPETFDRLAAIVLDTNESAELRRTALLALGTHFGARTMDVIRRVFAQGDRMVSVVCNALPLEKWSIDALLEYSKDKDPDIRRIAMNRINSTLHFDRDPRLVAYLAGMLTSDDGETRQQVALILGRIGDRSATQALVAALSSPNVYARIQSAYALVKIGDERAIPALESALSECAKAEADDRAPYSSRQGELRGALQSALIGIKRRLNGEAGMGRSKDYGGNTDRRENMTTRATSGTPIAGAFRRAKAEGRVALIPYVMAGYPDLETSAAVAIALCEAGADVLELGVPFSDPLADGATIQFAAQRALESGMTPSQAVALAGRVAARVSTPVVLMGYYNPIYSYGIEHFVAAAADAGVAGLIVPDLPPEEAEPLRGLAAARGIELIFLVSPTSTDARIEQVARVAGQTSGGFVYCVSLSGVTGAREKLPEQLAAFVARVRARTTLPLAVGFGVSKPEHVAEIGHIADGAVVASALLNAVDAAPPAERVQTAVAFLKSLQSGARLAAPATTPSGQ